MASKARSLSITTTPPKGPLPKNVGLMDLVHKEEEERPDNRPRRESAGTRAEGTATRLLKKLGATISNMDTEVKNAQALVKQFPNTKVEIKACINNLAVMLSGITTNEMRQLVEEGFTGEEPSANRSLSAEVESERGMGILSRKLDMILERVKALEDGQPKKSERKESDPKKGEAKDKAQERKGSETSRPGSATQEKRKTMAEVVAGGKAKPQERQPSEEDKKDEGWKQQKKRSKIAARPTRIMVSTEGSSYSKILNKLQAQVTPESGAEVSRAWKSRDGNVIVEAKRGGNNVELMKAIGNVVGQDKTRPTRGSMKTLEVKDVPEDITTEKVAEAISRATESKGNYTVREIRDYGKDFRIAMVDCYREDAIRLLQRGAVRIGWTQCKVQVKPPKPKSCAKCKGFGHWAENCKGEDKKDHCNRCGQKGHMEKTCKNPQMCFLCKEAGDDADHFRGSKGCQAYKKAKAAMEGLQPLS